MQLPLLRKAFVALWHIYHQFLESAYHHESKTIKRNGLIYIQKVKIALFYFLPFAVISLSCPQ
jgi:hypothetical protein